MSELFVALASSLVIFFVLTNNLAEVVSKTSPNLALMLGPTNAKALSEAAFQLNLPPSKDLRQKETPRPDVTQVEQQSSSSLAPNKSLNRDSDAGNASLWPALKLPPRAARRIAEKAIAQEPLNASAIGGLAYAHEQLGNKARARIFARIAASKSLHDVRVQQLLLKFAVLDEDPSAALNHLEIVYKTATFLQLNVLEAIAKLADSPRARPLVIERLKSDPKWGDAFLRRFPAITENNDNAFEILMALKQAGKRLETESVSAYMWKTYQTRKLDKAYYLWLQMLPPSVLENLPLIYNGAFDAEPSTLVFDWMLSQSEFASTEVKREDINNENKVLSVSFFGERIMYRHVSQVLMLTPGQYKLKGLFKLFDFENARGLVWRIYCLAGNTPLVAETERMRTSRGNWQAFEVEFEIPEDSNCSAQVLRLQLSARNGPESVVSGQAYFDNIEIERIPTRPNSRQFGDK